MKIAIVTDHFLPRVGGAEYASHCLAAALTERGHEVTVIAPDLKVSEIVTRYKIIRSINSRFFSSTLSCAFAIKKLKKNSKPDIIHAQLLFPAGKKIFPYTQYTNIPLIVSPQGADIHTFAPMNYGLLLQHGYQRKIKKLLGKLNAVTYSSRLMKQLIVDNGFHGKHLHYLPNGTFTSYFFHDERQRFRDLFKFPNDSIVITAVSRNSPIKGLSLLIQALRRLPSDLPEWHAIIAGSNVEKLTDEIHESGLLNKVRLMANLPFEYDSNNIPIIPSPTIANLLVASDIYAAPALSGGFELSSADALAAGLPTVIFDENGSKDIIEDTNAGIVVPTGDIDAFSCALATIIRDYPLRCAMRSNALASASNLDWHMIAQQAEQIYNNILTTQG
ncbi:MAG: glycosyltransferase family 1 protein [Nitrosomonas sp. PRO4]|nr:glycosyltransferase family 1 protein [Nitrosomonas sp. PRO4]